MGMGMGKGGQSNVKYIYKIFSQSCFFFVCTAAPQSSYIFIFLFYVNCLIEKGTHKEGDVNFQLAFAGKWNGNVFFSFLSYLRIYL